MKRLLYLLFLLTSPAMAVVLTPDTQFLSYDDWSGGLNTQSPSHRIPQNMSPAMQNVLIDEKPGSIVPRTGISTVGVTNLLTKINFMFEFVNNSGSREMLLADSSQVVTTTDFSTFKVLKSTLNTLGLVHAAQGRGKVLMCNGRDPCLYYDGTTCAFLDGNNGYPNVTGTWPAYYQERFFVFNTTANNSALLFSENSSTDGFAIDPLLDSRAWPAVNQLNIGLGDGRSGSGTDVFRGLLQLHKDNGAIYTLFGTDTLSYYARKTLGGNVGTISGDSIIQNDNSEYYVSRDGGYYYDGGNAVRITDTIKNEISQLVSNTPQLFLNIWDSQSDFMAVGGSILGGTTITASGFVQPLVAQALNAGGPGDVAPTASQRIQFVDVGAGLTSTTTGLIPFLPPYIDTSRKYDGFISTIVFSYGPAPQVFDPAVLSTDVVLTIRNLSTLKQSTCSLTCFHGGSPATFGGPPCIAGAVFDFRVATGSSGPIFLNTGDIINGKYAYKIDFDSNARSSGSNTDIKFGSFNVPGYIDMAFHSTSGSYTSQVTTATINTAWDQFTAVGNSNSGQVSYYVKAATSPASIATQTWVSISNAARIPFSSSKNYIQWASSLTATDETNVSNVDKIIIAHNISGAADARPFSAEYKKRWYLAGSTYTDGSNTIIYVKSRISNKNPNAWMKFTGINILSFSKFFNNLYAGSANSGTVYQMDSGQNDLGQPISWFYDTPDLRLGNPNFFEDEQVYYVFDVDQVPGGVLTIGTSVDGDAMQTSSIDLNGTGRLLRTLYNIPNNKRGKQFRFEFSGNQLDIAPTLHTFHLLYQPTKTLP